MGKILRQGFRKNIFIPVFVLVFYGASINALAGSPSLAPLNPEFVKYQNELKKAPAPALQPAGAGEHSLGAIPSPLDLSHDIGKKPAQNFPPPVFGGVQDIHYDTV
jgi:hypothetical protein